jgi:hypothetical protein
VMHAYERYAYERHAHRMHAMRGTPMRGTLIRCTPVRRTPIRHMAIRCTAMRCSPHEMHAMTHSLAPVRYVPMRHTPIRCTLVIYIHHKRPYTRDRLLDISRSNNCSKANYPIRKGFGETLLPYKRWCGISVFYILRELCMCFSFLPAEYRHDALRGLFPAVNHGSLMLFDSISALPVFSRSPYLRCASCGLITELHSISMLA